MTSISVHNLITFSERMEGSTSIKSSVCLIRTVAPGNELVTNGAGCVIKLPWDIEELPSKTGKTTATAKSEPAYVATTSQVVRKSDLNSKRAWEAEFSSVNWVDTEHYRLNGAPVFVVPIPSQNHDITLTLIPTEFLDHSSDTQGILSWQAIRQALRSWLFGNECLSARSQLSYQTGRESDLEATDARQRLYCYVPSENILSNDKFALQCYLLQLDKSGSYFLCAIGSKTELRSAEDFQSAERPKGSPILNEHGIIKGLLAFDEKDEIFPLFLPQTMPDGSLSRCGERNEVDRIFSLRIKTSKKDNLDSRRSKSSTEDRETAQSGCEDKVTGSGDTSSMPQNPTDAIAPPIRRSNSEQMTPRTRRDFLKSRSMMSQMPLIKGALVGDVITHDVYVMDTLSRHLDMSCRGIENWSHLANLNGVETYLQLKWQSGESHSRSEKVFEVVLFTIDPDLSIGTLQQHLRDLKINNVDHYIKSLHLEDDMKVNDFLESADLNIPGRVLIMLDLLPEETFQNLAVKLGVKREKLKQIKIDCTNHQENPAEHVIECIYRSDPTMTIGMFKKCLEEIQRLDVVKKLEGLPETWTIHELFQHLDLMREVTSMLNEPDSYHLKNYKDLADLCGISSELYKSFQPPCADSPTKNVINDIVKRRPTFSVEELFRNFRDMKRLDVIEALGCYFAEKDMRAIKRKLKISDEQM